ncbi:septum formation family protein [Streptomyces diastatochromogenes]|nr:septum formation family protein [Streptomyces diastatochromogenes]
MSAVRYGCCGVARALERFLARRSAPEDPRLKEGAVACGRPSLTYDARPIVCSCRPPETGAPHPWIRSSRASRPRRPGDGPPRARTPPRGCRTPVRRARRRPLRAPPRTTNGLAIGSLVSGIVCCLPPLGLILGLVALPQIRKRGQGGKGLAVAGIALSAVSCLLLVVGLVSGGFGSAWNSFNEGVEEASRSKSPSSLRTGQCFDDEGGSKKYTTEVTVVDCDRPHDGEVTGVFKMTGFEAWPGEEAADALAQKRCETINSAYAMDTWAIPKDVWIHYYLPSEDTWRLGDRSVICGFGSAKNPFSGSVRSDRSSLTADQSSFLSIVNPIETVGYREPEDDPDEDFAANKAWAGELLAAIDTARAGLGQRSWPGTPRRRSRSSARTSKRPRSAGAHWPGRPTRTPTGRVRPAWDALPEDLGADARTALGLTGTPPAGEGTET